MSELPGDAAQIDTLLRTPAEPEVQLVAFSQAIALADAQNDLPRGIRARLAWIGAAFHVGRHEEQLVHFTWIIAQCDKDPRLFERFPKRILWQFKWIMGFLPGYPAISRAQIERTLADMQRYYDKAGRSHRAIHGERAEAAMIMGDLDQLPAHRAAWLASPKDGSQDCPACEAAQQVNLFLATREFQAAVDAAAGLMDGRLRCAGQPMWVDADLLIPLFRLGRFDDAQRLQRRSWPKLRQTSRNISHFGYHVAYLALTDQLTRAVHVLEVALNALADVRRPYSRLHMLAGARVLLTRLQQSNKKHLKLRLRSELDLHRPDNTYTVPLLVDYTNTLAADIAAAFDARNGNRHASNLLTANLDLLDHIHPLKPPANPADPPADSES